jgi:putative phosphoesterase
MKKIILISDTHSYIPQNFWKFLDGYDELWHAGDVGNVNLIDKLKSVIPVRGIYGNIDGTEIRKEFPEHLIFTEQGVKIVMLHIGGKPYKYSSRMRELIRQHRPKVVVCGHSHILRVEFDKRDNLLYLNPGAIGNQGFHKVKTMLRFTLDNGEVKNMEAVELGPRG